MVISQEEKYIFIHIPKTAGTSITHSMLKETGIKPASIKGVDGKNHDVITHSGALQLKQILGVHYDEFYSFTVVRNPWDRMVSLYNFKLQSAQQRLSGLRPQKPGTTRKGDMKEIAYLSSLGFERWVFEGQCDNHLYGESLTKLPQLCWLTDEQGRLIVNHVAKFENLDQELEILKQKFAMNFNGPTGNPSIHAPWSLYYNRDTFECIKERFQVDIDEFGYEMTWEDILENQKALK